jgi:hypothetical protein
MAPHLSEGKVQSLFTVLCVDASAEFSGLQVIKWYWFVLQRSGLPAGHRWLTPVIIATQEAEIRRITV